MPEASYISKARTVATQREIITKAKKALKQAERECASLMSSYGVKSFTFKVGKKTYKARLGRETAKKSSPEAIWSFVRSGALTLEDFFELIAEFYPDKLESYLGKDRAESVLQNVQGPFGLSIKEVS